MSNKIYYVNQSACHFDRDIIDVFVNRGYQVILLTGNKSFKATVNKQIRTVILKKYNKNNHFYRFFSWLIFSLQVTLLLSFRNKCKVFLFSNPPLTIFIPLVLKLKEFALMIYDIYPDILIQTGFLSFNSPISRMWINVNKKSFSRASVIFTIGNGLAERISSLSNNKNIIVNPLWTDTIKFIPIKKNENYFAKEYGLENSFVVMYSGNLGKTHDVEVILELANNFLEDPAFKFLIIGEGYMKDLIAENLKKDNLYNCILLPKQSMEVLPYSLSCADVAVVSQATATAKSSIPSKLYNCMAVGSVILAITTEDSDLASIVKEHEIGANFKRNDISQMISFLRKLKNDNELLQRLKHNSRTASKLFTKNNAERIVQIWNNIKSESSNI